MTNLSQIHQTTELSPNMFLFLWSKEATSVAGLGAMRNRIALPFLEEAEAAARPLQWSSFKTQISPQLITIPSILFGCFGHFTLKLICFILSLNIGNNKLLLLVMNISLTWCINFLYCFTNFWRHDSHDHTITRYIALRAGIDRKSVV